MNHDQLVQAVSNLSDAEVAAFFDRGRPLGDALFAFLKRQVTHGDLVFHVCALAQNPNTSPELLRFLAEHHISNVRARVARNPSSPASAINLLRTDEDPAVAALAQERMAGSTAPQHSMGDAAK